MNREKLGTLLVTTSAILLGTSANQLWEHHPLGWVLFISGIVLIGARAALLCPA